LALNQNVKVPYLPVWIKLVLNYVLEGVGSHCNWTCDYVWHDKIRWSNWTIKRDSLTQLRLHRRFATCGLCQCVLQIPTSYIWDVKHMCRNWLSYLGISKLSNYLRNLSNLAYTNSVATDAERKILRLCQTAVDW